jgi:hypothetical protein
MVTRYLDDFIIITCKYSCLAYYINYLIHAASVHPSICLQYFNPDVYCNHRYCSLFSLMLLLHYCYCYKTFTYDKLLLASLFPGAAELTTRLLKLINILWLPL